MPVLREGIVVGVYVAVATCGMAWMWGNDRWGGPSGAVGISPGRMEVGGEEKRWKGVRVVVVIHPKCPCSLATLDVVGEAWRKRDRSRGAELTVLLVRPEGAEEGFESGRAGEAARRLVEEGGGGRVVVDVGGARARWLGATVSGHVAVYGDGGRLLASGGVTRSRGHAERSSVGECLALALGSEAGGVGTADGDFRGGGVTTAGVFGCGLGVGRDGPKKAMSWGGDDRGEVDGSVRR